VRAILDTNGLDTVSVQSVTDTAGSRIVTFGVPQWRYNPLRLGKVTVLPDIVGRMAALDRLLLQGCDLSALPDALGSLTNLKVLDVSGNGLKAVPATVGALAALDTLSLNGNELAALPASIGSLASLTCLDARDNKLLSLPPEITGLTSLTDLLLDNNSLSSLPAQIGDLAALKRLDVGNNVLAALPPQIGQLSLLQSLTLTNNHLTSLPNTIGNLDNLTELWLGDNLLQDMPAQIMGMDSLELLILWDNELSALSTTFREWADSTVPGWETPVKLLSPNGGNTYDVGDTVIIEWMASRVVMCLEFALRLDTTATRPIAPVNRCRSYLDDNWGRVEWVVPERLFDDTLVSHSCVLLAYSFVYPAYRDSSDSLFTILSAPQAVRDRPRGLDGSAIRTVRVGPAAGGTWAFDLRGRRMREARGAELHGVSIRAPSPSGRAVLRVGVE
jgi:hypothetical protein